MKPIERLKNWKWHDSMRGHFGQALYAHMLNDKNIWIVTGDIGYGLFDAHREDYPDRFINVGVAEHSMVDVAIGLSLSGKIPIVYSTTPFTIFRPFESIRTYINHESINIKLIGAGRDWDYAYNGISHNSPDIYMLMRPLNNIKSFYPETKQEIVKTMATMLESNQPCFLSLTR